MTLVRFEGRSDPDSLRAEYGRVAAGWPHDDPNMHSGSWILGTHREAQDLERETAANLWQDHDVVFACEDGRLIDPLADLREWSAILAQAGIPNAGTHTMRHSPPLSPWTRASRWPSCRRCSAIPISAWPASTPTCRHC